MPRPLLILLIPLIAARIVRMVMASRPGKKLARQAGGLELTTESGLDLASKYAALAAGVVGTAAIGMQDKIQRGGILPGSKPRTNWSFIAQDTSELLLATGGLLKVISDFLVDKQKLRSRQLWVGDNVYELAEPKKK